MGWRAAQRAQNVPGKGERARRQTPPGAPASARIAPRVFRRDLALDNVRRSRTPTHVGGVAEDRNLLRRLSPIDSYGA